MTVKRVLCPKRMRTIPAQFSWADNRLVRDLSSIVVIARRRHSALEQYNGMHPRVGAQRR